MKFIKVTDKDYGIEQLDENKIDRNPFVQFNRWFAAAAAANIFEYNAMTLATVNDNSQPSARIVLLRQYDEQGFVFFTNYLSRKGKELAVNNRAALLFWWRELEQQVRIEGVVEKITQQASTEYFQQRPRDSQISAWVSPQSDTIPDRYYLLERCEHFAEQYSEQVIPCPIHWGGFCLKPTFFEFWQGRKNRLHDRISYRLNEQNNWVIARLAP